MDNYGALKLTEQSRPVLRGERRLNLRRDPEKAARVRAKTKARGEGRPARADAAPLDMEATALWERLRALRRDLAAAQGVAPYVIFHDTTLREMLIYRPRSADELACISGVGAVKLERYGAEFLGALAEHAAEHGRPAGVPPLPQAAIRTAASPPPQAGAAPQGQDWDPNLSDTALVTLELLRTGLSPAQIAERRTFKLGTIYNHLSECIAAGELDLREVVSLSDQEIAVIEDAFRRLTADAPEALKPVYEAFQGRYDYDLLRCVRSAMEQT